MMNRFVMILVFMPMFCFGQWIQVGNSINGEAAGDICGFSSAISADGSIVAMGSPFNSPGGQVRVFEEVNGAWVQVCASINEINGGQDGQAVSLSADGNTVVVGGPFGFNPNVGFGTGHASVFRNINNNWVKIDSSIYGQSLSAAAGTSVDLSADGSIVAVGAPNTDLAMFSFAGNVRIFEIQNDSLVQMGADIESDGSVFKFGQSVSLSADGNIIAIGQSGDPFQGDIGRVKIYQFINNDWIQLGNTILGSTPSDEFGYTVSLSAAGNIVAIGTYGRNQVKIFELINNTWTQIGNTLVGETPVDAFGSALSLSNSGNRIAIGAGRNSINGDRSGRAYVFENQGGNWTQIDSAVSGVANRDKTGFSIALSQDGSRFITGALGNDDNGDGAGHVRVFENSSLVSTINHDENLDLVKIYPNPVQDVVQIESKEVINSYNVFSIDGRLVQQENGLNLAKLSIDVNHLTSGMYILTLQAQNIVKSFKIIKE